MQFCIMCELVFVHDLRCLLNNLRISQNIYVIAGRDKYDIWAHGILIQESDIIRILDFVGLSDLIRFDDFFRQKSLELKVCVD